MLSFVIDSDNVKSELAGGRRVYNKDWLTNHNNVGTRLLSLFTSLGKYTNNEPKINLKTPQNAKVYYPQKNKKKSIPAPKN